MINLNTNSSFVNFKNLNYPINGKVNIYKYNDLKGFIDINM